jgi:hypothetical protein
MTLTVILSILSALVPQLVSVAQTKFSGGANSAEARQWVTDGVNAILAKVETLEPSWAQTLTQDVQPLIDAAINLALTKLGVS